jgi:hypothetical protein
MRSISRVETVSAGEGFVAVVVVCALVACVNSVNSKSRNSVCDLLIMFTPRSILSFPLRLCAFA